MSQVIEVPGQGMVEFPDSMSDDDIAAVLRNEPTASNSGFDTQSPEVRSAAEIVGRALGRAGRDVFEGAAGIAGIFTNPISFGVNRLSNALGGPDLATEDFRGSVSSALSDIGVPAPETRGEEIVSNINQMVIGGGGFVGAGRAIATQAGNIVARNVGKSLAANPTLQGASAVSSATGGEIAEELGATPGQKALVQIATGILPAAVNTVGAASVRGIVRGGEQGRQTVARNVETFERAGTTPTVGQATQGRAQQTTESILAKTPGSAGVFADKAKTQAQQVAARVQQRADELLPNADPAKAGRIIEKGIRDGFVNRFKNTAKRLYDEVDQHLDTSQGVSASNTAKHLESTTSAIEGAEATSKVLSNSFLDDIRTALEQDLVDGALPYIALKQLRTRVGERISNLTLVSDVTKGQLKQLYGAISGDLTEAAKQAGPRALQATQRANRFYSAGQKRIDAIESVVKKKGGPEKIFQAAVSGTKEGATTLRSVMRSLDLGGKKAISAAVIRRLGKATPGRQNADVDEFSMETFLTGWANLSKEARSILFGRFGKKFAKDMDAIAQVSSNIRDGSGVFRNPSGTSPALVAQGTTAATVYSIATGQLQAAGVILGAVASANAVSRAMTNPRFVNWLATSTTIPVGAYAAQVQILARIASETSDEDLALIAAMLEER